MKIIIKKYDWGYLDWETRVDMPTIPEKGDVIVRHDIRYTVKSREFDIDNDNICVYVD